MAKETLPTLVTVETERAQFSTEATDSSMQISASLLGGILLLGVLLIGRPGCGPPV
jgi:hypothetical protein